MSEDICWSWDEISKHHANLEHYANRMDAMDDRDKLDKEYEIAKMNLEMIYTLNALRICEE